MKTLFILLQHLLPQHLLSRLAGRLADSRIPWLKNSLIRLFIRRYSVNMNEAQSASADDYPSFNEFFTRALKSGSRPLQTAPDAILCPADGQISAIGSITAGRLLQAKGRDFSLTALLGGDTGKSAVYHDGSFATVYLSPRDYHRVHMPLTGTLREMIHVPGKLFSVNQTTSEGIADLFARNERVICHFDTAHGPMALILVGAMIVASIETVWAGRVAPASGKPATNTYSGDAALDLQQGAEMGRFRLGSTVIMLFGPGLAVWQDTLAAGSPVQMGQLLGRLKQEPKAR